MDLPDISRVAHWSYHVGAAQRERSDGNEKDDTSPQTATYAVNPRAYAASPRIGGNDHESRALRTTGLIAGILNALRARRESAASYPPRPDDSGLHTTIGTEFLIGRSARKGAADS
jgi:hypothetical protein